MGRRQRLRVSQPRLVLHGARGQDALKGAGPPGRGWVVWALVSVALCRILCYLTKSAPNQDGLRVLQSVFRPIGMVEA